MLLFKILKDGTYRFATFILIIYFISVKEDTNFFIISQMKLKLFTFFSH